MARIRTIKPEFFTSEDIVSLSPLARLLYIAIWCEADKEGRLAWKPKTLKMRYLPGDECDINALCRELVDCGQVVLYGDGLAYIPAFTRHQHVNPRESKSNLPAPNGAPPPPVDNVSGVDDNNSGIDASNPDDDAQVGREGKGRERKGKEGVASDDATPAGVSDSVWRDFLKTRKTKITKTALDGIRAEAAKASLTLEQALTVACKRGWQTFEAAWQQDIRAPDSGDTADPDSRAAVMARAAAFGVAPWDEIEQWAKYKRRVERAGPKESP